MPYTFKFFKYMFCLKFYLAKLSSPRTLNYFNRSIILGVLTSILVACSSALTPTATPTSMTLTVPYPTLTPITNQGELLDAAKERWLKGDPCAPPCFEQITPSITTAAETAETLRKNSLAFDIQIDAESVAWYWAGQSVANVALFNPNDPDKVIKNIRILFPTRLLFQEVLDVYGEPSHLIFHNLIQHNGLYLNIWAIYASQGFALRTAIGPLKTLDEPLNDTLTFERGYFFIPGVAGIAEAISSSWTNDDIQRMLVPWQGFQDYRFYCREISKAESSCKDPTSP